MPLLTRIFIACFAVIGFISSFQTDAASSVWKVNKGEHSFYLGGTIHLLKPGNYPLPPEFAAAFNQADKLVFETDVAFITGPGFQQALFQQALLPAGQSLDSLLSPEPLAALKNKLASIGLPYTQIAGLKPGVVVATMTVVELQSLGFTAEGVDVFFYKESIETGKATDYLEPPEAQINLITQMGQDDPDSLVNYSLQDIEDLPNYAQDMYEFWRNGEVEALFDLLGEPMQKSDPQIFSDLIEKRNNAWMPKILAMANTPEVELYLVGALHLGGESGIIAQLKQQGFEVTQL